MIRAKIGLIATSVAWMTMLLSGQAGAHSPHDVTTAVKIARTQAGEEAVFALVRSNLLRSHDGGSNWRRLIRGLDHKFPLSGLDVSGDGTMVYVSSLGDGIYRSSDGGDSFENVSGNLENLIVDIVAMAPWDSAFVLASHAGDGLVQSRNGGNTWATAEGAFGKVTAISMGRFADDPIFVGDHAGALFRSHDAGQTWEPTWATHGAEGLTAIGSARNSRGEFEIYAGTAHGRVFYSNDNGATFSEVASTGDQKPIRSITLSPSFARDGRIFVSGWDAGALCGKSGDQRWESCASGLTRDSQSRTTGKPSFNEISLSPGFERDETLFMAGFDGLFVSRDGAGRWRQIDTLSPFNIISVSVSPGHEHDSTIAFTNLMWGAFLSRDGGGKWRTINRGAIDQRRKNGLTCLFDVVFSPDFQKDGTLFTSTWWRILKSEDRGGNWRQIVPVQDPEWTRTHHASTIALSPGFAADQTVFAATHTGLVLKSLDGAESFEVVARPGSQIGSIAVSPDFPQDETVFVADTSRVHISRDAGRTWTSSGLLDTTRFTQPYVSPSHPPDDAALLAPTLLFNMNKTLAIKLAVPMGYRTHGTVFAGTAAGLFRSTDHGLTWLPLSHFLLPEDAYIEAVSVSPAFEDDRTVIVSVRGHGSLMSQDGGENFVHFARELDEAGYPLANYEGNTPPFAPIVFSPGYATDHAVYAFSGPHLFKSSDRGLSWAELDTPSADWRDRLRVWYSSSGRRDKFLVAAGGTALPLFLMLGIWAARWAPSWGNRKSPADSVPVTAAARFPPADPAPAPRLAGSRRDPRAGESPPGCDTRCGP